MTNAGKLAVDDQVGKVVYSYNPPSGGNLGSPVATTPLTSASDPVNFAFGKPNVHLYTADGSLGQAQKFNFPAGGAAVLTSSLPAGASPIGIAINPTAQYVQF